MDSGLYLQLVEAGLLIPHTKATQTDEGLVIRPQLVPAISYPYEWSFSQLQDAALATLQIQRLALEHGLTLRDASAYNIQFVDGKPCLIDTLSFDIYTPGQPWVAYRQYCQHFLAPLALMAHTDLDLGQLLRVYIDGVPLPLAAKLLPRGQRYRGGLGVHLTLHARLQRQHQSDADKPSATRPTRKVSTNALRGIIAGLDRATRRLKLPVTQTEWGNYYQATNYSSRSMKAKAQLVDDYLAKVKPKRALDLGANDGTFSRLSAAQGAYTISCDIDPLAVEANYHHVRENGETNLLPLLIDLTNPSPALGWAGTERQSFTARAKSDCALALALVHHLAISNNLPLEYIAAYLAELAPHLIIEFVPKSDSQVKRLLTSREDIFPSYTQAGFEAAFGQHFQIVEQSPITGTKRTLYLLKRLAK